MSDHYKGCWVAFENDISQEYAERVVAAIQLLAPVQAVTLSVANCDDWMARGRAKQEILGKIRNILLE